MDLIESVHTYHYNPFKFGEYLVSFYSELKDTEQNFLLLPLIIPICTHPVLHQKLDRVVLSGLRRTTFFTKFNEPKELYDLQERVDYLKKITAQTLHYCLINDWVFIDEKELAISVTEGYSKRKNKKAGNLGKLFSGLSANEIYRGLRVKP